jgi:hypothetical protein
MTGFANFCPKHFHWSLADSVAIIRLARPDRKNPLTFDSYAELRDTFRALSMPTMWTPLCSCPTGQFLFRRRCARHHRPADENGHEGSVELHPHDR